MDLLVVGQVDSDRQPRLHDKETQVPSGFTTAHATGAEIVSDNLVRRPGMADHERKDRAARHRGCGSCLGAGSCRLPQRALFLCRLEHMPDRETVGLVRAIKPPPSRADTCGLHRPAKVGALSTLTCAHTNLVVSICRRTRPNLQLGPFAPKSKLGRHTSVHSMAPSRSLFFNAAPVFLSGSPQPQPYRDFVASGLAASSVSLATAASRASIS